MLGHVEEGAGQESSDAFAQDGCLDKSARLDGRAAASADARKHFFVLFNGFGVQLHGEGFVEWEGDRRHA